MPMACLVQNGYSVKRETRQARQGLTVHSNFEAVNLTTTMFPSDSMIAGGRELKRHVVTYVKHSLSMREQRSAQH